jgi:hypothetical protein
MASSATTTGTIVRIHRLLRSNWITSLGAALMTLAVLGFVTVFAMHAMGGAWAGPYIGIITGLALPALFVLGMVMVPAGLFLFRKRLNERLEALADKPVSLARAVVVLTAINFAAIGTLGYTGAHYMSSVQFCGTACHAAMDPEYVAFQRSPHARVDCVACHVAPGTKGYIEAKLNGTKQLYGFLTDSYRRPIPTPVEHLVPAKDTCERCHWPEKYLGTKLKVKSHYREDESVSGFTNVLLMRTGGTRADGQTVGIHWHVNPDVTIEYVASDEKRTRIPWIRVVRKDGSEMVFTSPGASHDAPAGERRKMDCNDCHNRSAHAFDLPDAALDNALAAGLIPRDLPFVKKYAMEALTTDWTRDNAKEGIRQHLQQAYAKSGQLDETTRQKLEKAIEEVAAIWLRNVWPERKLGWNEYPDLATHVGCFRCHDGKHVTSSGHALFGPDLTANSNPSRDASCDRCHVVLSENEEDPAVLESLGLRR